MTVILKNNDNNDYVCDSDIDAKVSWFSSFPKGLTLTERIRLYRHGKKDARSGVAVINEYNELSSVYCESLLHHTNQQIEIEWKKCNSVVFEIVPKLEEIHAKMTKIEEEIKEISLEKNNAVSSIKDIRFDGDNVVSKHLSHRRKQNRIKRVREYYEKRISSLNEQIENMELSLIPFQRYFFEAEEVARCNEQLARTCYLWRLTAYAYGASNYLKITPELINDNSVTRMPSQKHNELFCHVKTMLVTTDNTGSDHVSESMSSEEVSDSDEEAEHTEDNETGDNN